MHHIAHGIRERWLSIPEDQRDLVMKALTRKEQQIVRMKLRMQAIGGGEPEDQHVFDFPGVGKLIATKEMGDFLRIDFVPDLVTPECPETLLWPAEPSAIATVAMHHLTMAARSHDDDDYKNGPMVIVNDGTNGDPAVYVFIPKPGRAEVTADIVGRILSVTDGWPRKVTVKPDGSVEYD